MDIIRSRRFGDLVRQARIAQGMTQADLAGRVGAAPGSDPPKYLGATQISRIEAGVKEVERWHIGRLTEALGLDRLEVLEAISGLTAEDVRLMLDERERNLADRLAEADELIEAGAVDADVRAVARMAKHLHPHTRDTRTVKGDADGPTSPRAPERRATQVVELAPRPAPASAPAPAPGFAPFAPLEWTEAA